MIDNPLRALLRRGRALAGLALAAVAALAGAATPARAQWVRTYEQFYLPASHNWAFREHYRAADRLFNAFDYGHAILYEELWTHPNASPDRLERARYDFITRRLLPSPPRVPLAESAIEVEYAKLAPEAKMMFHWAHLLHRQVYDVWADERIPDREKDARVAELLRYYKSRPELAFSSSPKSMDLMEGQYYSRVFRQRYPKFNGLIWAYHWLQVGLYDALMASPSRDARQANVNAAVARFWQMLADPPASMPRVMPMTAAVAPRFATRYPELAIIFDNLHSMHDVVSDILASPKVPRNRKRAEILAAAARYRDNSSFVTSRDEWRSMATAMGLANMGGAAVGLLEPPPAPTLAPGAAAADAHAAHGAAPGADSTAAHRHDDATAAPDSARAPGESAAGAMRVQMELHRRMMADSVIRRRVLADTAMRRLLLQSIDSMPAEHRTHLREMLDAAPADSSGTRPPAARPDTTPRPARRAPAADTARTPPHHGHHPPPAERR